MTPARGLGLVGALLRHRIVRFGLVGGVGIPINVALLWFFHTCLRAPTLAAWAGAFECSALCNFYANQRFTYWDQTHVRGIEWLKRALRAQLSSISGVTVNTAVFGLLLSLQVHYLEADVAGIVAAFSVNFLIANRFVFTPVGSDVDKVPVG